MTRFLRLLFYVICLWVTHSAVGSAQGLSDEVRAASEQVAAARVELEKSKTAKDRVRALTETISSFEQGLSVMRNSLRAVTAQHDAIRAQLDAEQESYSKLLGILLSIDKNPVETQILHPDGPLTTVRSAMLVADVLPAIQSRVAELRGRFEELEYLNELQFQVVTDLQTGLENLQTARVELTRAVTDRSDLPRRFTEDPEKTDNLLAASDTLAIFADGLDLIAVDIAQNSLPSILDRKGDLPLPVDGRVIRFFQESDAAGINRPGIVVATAPQAIVKTPTAATIRYRGPLLDYGLITILEPQNGILFVLAGLDQVFGDIGQVMPAGSPVGIMGGNSQTIDAIIEQNAKNSGQLRSETLYIEVRDNQTPQDPAEWFRIGGN